ncbi:hypothetical protein COO60DRAFT_1140192 [Scenedesmus sp. NREL 46B-D3]|nr:hypothetical protein COO60DRAFT_1140192 [Scenedesmus sp. NREL 46B-D3]
MMIAGEATHDGSAKGSHASSGLGAASAAALLLLVATALCIWHRRRRSVPEEAADKWQLQKDLLHAHDSVVVARKRISGEEVTFGANILATYDSSDGCGYCRNSSGGAAAPGRVPMVGFLDLPEEEQQRLRAGNINDSVLIIRNKRATSGASSSAAKGGEAAVAYYQQQLAQLHSNSDGCSNSGHAEGAARTTGQLRGRSSDGSECGKRVQFGVAQVVAVSSSAGATSAVGDAPEAGAAEEAGTAAAAATVLEGVHPEHATASDTVLLPGGVDGGSISIDTSELGAGQGNSRGDDTARTDRAQLPGSTS